MELESKLQVDLEILEGEAERDVDSTAPEISFSNAKELDLTAKELKKVWAEGILEFTRLDQRLSSAPAVWIEDVPSTDGTESDTSLEELQ